MTIRVLLADDQALLRATFRLLLDSTADIQVVGEAANGAEAVEKASGGVDVIVMDIRMPGMDGIEATRLITADPTLSGVHVLVLTTFETDDLIMAALRAGAAGYIGKGIEPPALLDAIRTVAAGESLLSPAAATAVIRRALESPPPRARESRDLSDLTARELQIVAMVGAGLSNTEIAAELFISVATAKTHINRAMTKTGARDRAQLVIVAYENRLVE